MTKASAARKDREETPSNAGGAAAEEGKGAGESPSPWLSAVDKYREAAKWAIGVLGVIGALLAGTAPLAGIGNLEPGNIRWVLSGAILGLTGTGAAIAAYVATLVPRTVYWHEIRPKKQRWFFRNFVKLGPLEDILASETKRGSVLPLRIDSPRALEEGIRNLRMLVDQQRRIQADPSLKSSAKKAAAEAEEGWTSELEGLVENQLELLRNARFEKARTGFRVAFVAMVFGGILAGGGLGMLLYGLADQTAVQKARAEVRKLEAEADKAEAEIGSPAAGDNDSGESSDVGGSALPTSTVLLSEEGRAVLGERLGRDCDTAAAIPIAVLGGDAEIGSWDVMVVGQPNCALVRFVLNPALGSIAD